MQFAKRLRPLVRSGAVTCSIRIWQSPRVRTGGRYSLQGGHVVIDSVRDQVTDDLARRSGFADVADLLATARHGSGDNVYLVTFHYDGPPVSPADA